MRVGTGLDRLGFPWVLGGSLASSLAGEPRSTNDIDVALKCPVKRVDDLVDEFAGDYYAPVGPLSEAAKAFGSFNLIHHQSSFKVDLFFLGDNLLDTLQLKRKRSI